MGDPGAEWISYATAARILGVSVTTVRNLIHRGELVHRPGVRPHPSLSRGSVLAAREARGAAAAAAEQAAQERAARNQPPPDGEVWLSLPEVALVLGVTRTRVGQLVAAGRIPATRVGRRWWVQRLHAEMLSSVRATRARR